MAPAHPRITRPQPNAKRVWRATARNEQVSRASGNVTAESPKLVINTHITTYSLPIS
jgi:hypothetical protein